MTGMKVGPLEEGDGPDDVEEPLKDWNKNVAPYVVGSTLPTAFGMLRVVNGTAPS